MQSGSSVTVYPPVALTHCGFPWASGAKRAMDADGYFRRNWNVIWQTAPGNVYQSPGR
ncbi:MAG: hypothetical protein OHK0029_31460 [Armatimonadaceae bacterium]